MLKRFIRWLLELLLIIVVIFLLRYYDVVVYGLRQLKGQLTVVWNTRTIEEVLNDPQLPDTLKQKLRLIQEIKTFAVDSLGISPSDNYTTFYDQKGKPVLWAVAACPSFQLEAYSWSFPFVGSFPYKGFFELEKAKEETGRLKKEGCDVSLGSVGGWSTLGWFSDPVLSGMLTKSEGKLAELIIHELTHGTLYVKSNADFNENLANFIGTKGASRFLATRYGDTSQMLQRYYYEKSDEKLFTDYILSKTQVLKQFYDTLHANLPDNVKQALKNEQFVQMMNGLDSLELTNRKRYQKIREVIQKEQNCFFMEFKRYDARQELFEKELLEKFQGNIKNYVSWLKETYPSL